MAQTWGKEIHCFCESGNRSCIYLWFYHFLFFLFFYFVLCIFYFVFCIVVVTSLGHCCRHSGGFPQSLDCWSSWNVRGKIREVEVDDDKGMVNYVESVQNLGGREMLTCMREEISVCVVVVVVLTVVVGVGELMMVVGMVCFGEMEVDCSGVVDTFVLGGDFVVLVVEVELVVECVLQLVLWCSNRRGNFW